MATTAAAADPLAGAGAFEAISLKRWPSRARARVSGLDKL